MSITVVHTTQSTEGGSVTVTKHTGHFSVTIPWTPTAGNTLVLALQFNFSGSETTDQAGITGVVDSLGNAFTQATGAAINTYTLNGSTEFNYISQIWYIVSCSDSTALTINYTPVAGVSYFNGLGDIFELNPQCTLDYATTSELTTVYGQALGSLYTLSPDIIGTGSSDFYVVLSPIMLWWVIQPDTDWLPQYWTQAQINAGDVSVSNNIYYMVNVGTQDVVLDAFYSPRSAAGFPTTGYSLASFLLYVAPPPSPSGPQSLTHVWVDIFNAQAPAVGTGGGGTGTVGSLAMTTTMAAYIGHNTSANSSYNQYTFPSNFSGTTWVDQSGDTMSVNSAIEDDSLNPITPCHVSPVSVKTMTPSYTGKRTILVVPYNFWGSGDGSGGHVDFGINTDTTAWAYAACTNMQYRGYDGITVDWYGPSRYEDYVTLLLQSQIDTMIGFTYALMIDTSGGSYSTQAELESYLSYMQSQYFGDTNYRTISGKAVVYMWGPTVLTDAEYVAAKGSIGTSMYWIGQGPGSLSMSSMDAAFDWVQPYGSGVNYSDPYNLSAKGSFISSCSGSSKGSVLAISPGFNGYLTESVGWSKGKYMPRDSGKCWLTQSSYVNSNISTIQSGGGTLVEIQDATWNDWQEGTEMEDAIDNGIIVIASLGGASGTIVSWTYSGGTGDETTISSYAILATINGIQAALLGTQTSGGSHTFDLSTISGWGSVNYTIYVVAIGLPAIRSQCSNPVIYTYSG